MNAPTGTLAVICGGCNQQMRRARLIARAVHTHVSDTLHVRYECDTPDCGTDVVIEEDSP